MKTEITPAGTLLSSLADRIRDRRLAMNIPQSEMARRVGLSRRAYQEFEKTGVGSTKTLVNALFLFNRSNELRDLLKGGEDFESIEEFQKAHIRRRRHASARKATV